jgi:indole-3-glycerol phosphate synthase
MDLLEQIAESRRRDLSRSPGPGLDVAPPSRRRPCFREAILELGLSLIAEIKRRTPSAGPLALYARAGRRARAYELGGASAISVLTEPAFFAGSYSDLREAAENSSLPVLCKDFVVDERQILWAAEAGASCVLLIVRILPDASLCRLLQRCRELGLDALVEVYEAAELERALACGADLIGINSRDLRDFSVRFDRLIQLRDKVPSGIPVVAESGVRDARDLLRLQEAGFDAALVGTALMRSRKPGTLLRSWRTVLEKGAGESLWDHEA